MAQGFLSMLLGGGSIDINTLMTSMPVKCHSIDRDGVIINVSNAWATYLQYDPGEMIGRPSTDFLTPDSRIMAKEKWLPQFFARGTLLDIPYEFEDSHGNVKHVLMSASLTSQNGSRPQSLAVFFENQAAEELQALRHSLSMALSRIDEVSPEAALILRKSIK